MHQAPMKDSYGEFGKAEEKLYTCRQCGEKKAQCQSWDSSCGGYTDYRYRCMECSYTWWVDGDDG